ncbi:unnamed protein product [Pleuronectes platessa]|uniref:Uncharacterized protein n=1 Tax=Pleuronectes platessa TaxID=8262 RepID=A0A9N7VHB9_PLEPL|nr:unnamed protein product [Pleuronectes platessa]
MEAEVELSIEKRHTISFVSLLARRLILLRWRDASSPTHAQWLEEIMSCLKLEKEKERERPPQRDKQVTPEPPTKKPTLMLAHESSSDEEEDSIEQCLGRYKAESLTGMDDCPQEWWSTDIGTHSEMARLARNCDTAVNPCRTKHHSVAEETRPNSVPRARRIRSISGPSTKPLQQMNQRYPAQAMTSSPNSGDSLTACTPRNTTRDSLDFWKIRATRKQHRKGHNR